MLVTSIFYCPIMFSTQSKTKSINWCIFELSSANALTFDNFMLFVKELIN